MNFMNLFLLDFLQNAFQGRCKRPPPLVLWVGLFYVLTHQTPQNRWYNCESSQKWDHLLGMLHRGIF
jgi:hypothetical protein